MVKINNVHVLSLSYGKDSIAALEAIRLLDYPLDYCVHSEVWATDTIQGDLPPMIEFKKHADRLIKEKYGVDVIHMSAVKNGEKLTYEKIFYQMNQKKGRIYGFPMRLGPWCTDRLKTSVLSDTNIRNALMKIDSHIDNSANIIQYLGIANDEPIRIERHIKKKNIILPLVDIGWDENHCFEWCKENNLLSPIYQEGNRGGCWFCHNQSVSNLRMLYHDYPELWQVLLRWEKDSPVQFTQQHTLKEYHRRFWMEDEGFINKDKPFRWKMIK